MEIGLYVQQEGRKLTNAINETIQQLLNNVQNSGPSQVSNSGGGFNFPPPNSGGGFNSGFGIPQTFGSNSKYPLMPQIIQQLHTIGIFYSIICHQVEVRTSLSCNGRNDG